MTALEEYPTDDIAVPQNPEERQRFRVDNDRKAAWAMRELRRVRRRRLELASIAQAEIDRIQRWASDEDEKLAPDADFFVGLLTEYALEERARTEGTKHERKSVSTPYGVVKTRMTGTQWDWDAEAFIAWAKDHRPELVKTVDSIKYGDAKRALDVADGEAVDPESGEVVPGVKVGDPVVTATVDVDLALHAEEAERDWLAQAPVADPAEDEAGGGEG